MESSGFSAPSATPPFAFFEWMAARRYLGATRTGKGVSLISIIAFFGIMLAVAVLIIVMSVMQGFRAKLLDQLLGLNGHVFVQSDEPISNYDVLALRLINIPGVTHAAPLIQAPVYATAKGEAGVFVRAMRKEDLMKVDLVTGVDQLRAGSFETFGEGKNGGNEIALGSRLAHSLGVTAGDPVTLVSGRGADTPFGPTLRKKTYLVGAVYEVGMSEYDGLFIFMPLNQAQLFFNQPGAVQQIEIRVADLDKLDQIKPEIIDVAGGFDITDWRQVNASYFNALAVERNVMRLILSLIVAIAALNIVTGLVMLVKDKTGDIAVLRTMGATQGSVMRIFFLSGSMIGVFGTLMGVVLGAVFVWNIEVIENLLSAAFGVNLFNEDIYFFKEIPAQMQAGEVAFIAGFSLFMSFVVTIYPAWRAARLDPVEALRYE